MWVKRSTALIITVLLLTIVSTVAGFIVAPSGYLSPLAGPPLPGATGGIAGNITIRYISPLCRVPQTTEPAPPYYNQIGLVIFPSPSTDFPLIVPVNWVLVNGCVVQGTFKAGLIPGSYSLTLTSCYGIHDAMYRPYSPSCRYLPKTVVVQPGAWTQVEIVVNTGIY
jgi:hypothetical protein